VNLLLVSYYAPPTVTPRAARLAELARALLERGHQVQILTSTNEGKDTVHLEKILGAEVLSVPLGPLGRAQRKSSPSTPGTGDSHSWKRHAKQFAHGLLFPEWQSEWVFQARSVQVAPPDRVISLVAPFSGAILGDRLARRWGVPHIMDYGDPWSHSVDRGLGWRQPLDRQVERRLLGRARAVVVNAQGHARRLREVFPSVRETACFWNGYDPADFSGPLPAIEPAFRHVGQLYSARLPLQPLFQVLPEFPELFPLHQIGPAFGQKPAALNVHPPVSFAEAVISMRSAQALLLLGSPGDVQLPSKLFHYAASGRPFLIIADGKASAYTELPLDERAVICTNEPSDLRRGLASLREQLDRTFAPLNDFDARGIMHRYAEAIEGWK